MNRNYPIRNNIEKIKRKFREHFNKNKKTKLSFEDSDEAVHYINSHSLKKYSIYKCSYCNKYHISKNNNYGYNNNILT